MKKRIRIILCVCLVAVIVLASLSACKKGADKQGDLPASFAEYAKAMNAKVEQMNHNFIAKHRAENAKNPAQVYADSTLERNQDYLCAKYTSVKDTAATETTVVEILSFKRENEGTLESHSFSREYKDGESAPKWERYVSDFDPDEEVTGLKEQYLEFELEEKNFIKEGNAYVATQEYLNTLTKEESESKTEYIKVFFTMNSFGYITQTPGKEYREAFKEIEFVKEFVEFVLTNDVKQQAYPKADEFSD